MFPKRHEKIWALAGLVIAMIFIYYVAKNLRDIKTIVSYAGLTAPVVIIILYALFAITPISTDPLTVVSSAMFGPLFGVLISWIGNCVASLVEYYFGSHIGKIANFKEIRKKLPFGLGKLPINSPWFLIGGRLIPGYGGKIISILAGVHHVKLILYLWTSALTNFLGSLFLVLGGYHIIRLIHLLK
ncbi:hypothetical protein AUK04_01840 [Candidatus Roizmanbacteria bacterium CG2_30_33_16]|nr:MAG: hypothetical protein AUK04_01840 [Candidatus Roizmanbacteria bacterium CG2_30_33_16]